MTLATNYVDAGVEGQASQERPSLPANLVQARRLRSMGLSMSGLMLLGGLGVAFLGDVPLPRPPDWVPNFFAIVSTVGFGGLAATKFIMGDALQIEVHEGRLYIQHGVPVSGPPAGPNSIQVMQSSF